MSLAMSGFAARVKAVLGPTNTGKTHLAMERLLAHASGIIGFPLRLLARENYDRMVAQKGVRHVALITGEEKIIPPEARWFACTVEAMPLDRPAEFVAVDEIQLCADPDRGHVFTDRLLHARGLVETMFLGAETIRPLLKHLAPQAHVETRPRLSQLEYAGPAKLTKLPPRTAVVAFSADSVYAIAELIRRRRGGCAVVMGRLSPRTRNAQVALYQAKEVDFLVATDAIGMGLNMDVDHVAFARLSKHDGHRPRRLTAAEIAQIAGRAGRGMRDGTFGTTANCQPMGDDLAMAVEAHSFDALEQLCWRNSDLDFSHVDALLGSLTAPPPRQGLVKGNDAADLETLAALAREPEIRALAQGRRRVRLLWEACQIPDFRKLADETHTRLCARVFDHVVRDGTLPTDWLAGQIAGVERTDGDLDTLMQRLAGIRIWSYIAARADWVRDAAHWQGRAREVEDKLSDALHERLIARFVDRRAAHLMRRLDAGEGQELLSAVTRRGEVVVEGHPVGHVAGFGFLPDPLAVGDEKKLVWRAARRALREEMPRRVALAEAAPDGAFGWTDGRAAVGHAVPGNGIPGHAVPGHADPGHDSLRRESAAPHVPGPCTSTQHLTWDSVAIARLRPGSSALRPRVEVLDSEFLDGAQRERLRTRLQTYVEARIRVDLAPLFAVMGHAEAFPDARGPLHLLREALGVVPEAAAGPVLPALRPRLKQIGVRTGRFALFVPALLKARPTAMRARLWALHHGLPVPTHPPLGLVSLPPPSDWPSGFAAVAGWLEAGPVLLRLDVAERAAAEFAWATRRGATVLPTGLAGRFAVKAELVPAVLRGLGFRVLPGGSLGPGGFGPPTPPMLAPLKRRRVAPVELPDAPHSPGPFAALAALKR
jgi:ATP-dependent RNA helicase SUPV3L1/SUV3